MNFRFSFLFFAVFCISFAAAACPSGQKWCYCPSSSAGHLTVSDVTMNPDPPARGTDEVVALKGTVDEVVTAGNITLEIFYLGFPVYTDYYDVCTTTTCPSGPGPISAAITIPGSAIPGFSPSGAYVGQATMTDQNQQSLACVEVDFTLGPSYESSKISPESAAQMMALFNKARA